MDWRRFVAAAFVGRLIRFLGEAYAAMKFGDGAADIRTDHYPWIAGALAAAVILFLLLRRFSAGREPRTLVGRAKPLEGPVADGANAARSGGESGASRV